MIKRCKRCGVEKPFADFHKSAWNKIDGRQDWCKVCRKAQAEKTRDKDIERYRQWYQDNKEQAADNTRRWRRENNDRRRELARAERKRSYDRDPEKHRKRALEYNRANPDITWVRHMKKLAIKWDCQEITATYADWLDVLEQYGERCYYCGQEEKKPHTEHKTPLARGGPHAKENIVPACNSCNVKKGQLTEVEFREVLARAERGAVRWAQRLTVRKRRGDYAAVAEAA